MFLPLFPCLPVPETNFPMQTEKATLNITPNFCMVFSFNSVDRRGAEINVKGTNGPRIKAFGTKKMVSYLATKKLSEFRLSCIFPASIPFQAIQMKQLVHFPLYLCKEKS